MDKSKTKQAIEIALFAFLLLLATSLSRLHKWMPSDLALFYSFAYVLSIGIHISLFFAWTVSIYNRIMQSRVRTYLMLIGANIILWIGIRGVKWGPFGKIAFGDRMAWYMFYIPMIMIPLLFFFTALCVGQDEHYRPNKKWNLLFIPAILLIALVLTNDFHLLVFGGINLDIHMYERPYDHKIGYYVVAIFLVALILLSTTLITKKFRYSVSARRASRLPMLVVGCVILYTVLLVIGPVYGVEYYFMDVTIFSCTSAVAFWEACIRTGLVHSNGRHKEFFEMATTNAQVLTASGEVAYTAENAPKLTRVDFERLKESKVVHYDKNTLLHISPIKGGYVSWSSDVSGIKSVIGELEGLNEKLHERVEHLSLENTQKKENTREKKLSELQGILRTEALPYSEKIKNAMTLSEEASPSEIKQLLFATSIISTYLKRKVNLILIEQTEKCISADEMHRAFSEVFEGLRLEGRMCELNIAEKFDLNLATAMLCFDLFMAVIEHVTYDFNLAYLSFRQKGERVIFAIQVSGDREFDISAFENFEEQKLSTLNGKLAAHAEEESYHISLSIPK